MGVALFIVPEREVEGLDTFVNGKALAHVDDLDDLARAAGVRPLMEFFSQSRGDLLGLVGEEGDDGELHLPEGVEAPPEGWFDAGAGLETVRGLLRLLGETPEALGRTTGGFTADGVVEDLRGFEEVLAGLAREGVRWHLAVDI
jgi:hypothetical protein